MKNKKRFLSAFIALSCLSTNSNACEKQINKTSEIKSQNTDSESNKRSLIIFLTALGLATPIIAPLAYDEYQTQKLNCAENYVEQNYIEIMKPYVHVDGNSIYWASDSDWSPNWDAKVDNFLKHELAISKYLLDKDGIETGNDKVLFPFTLLRILKLDNVLQELCDKNYDKVYISFSGETGRYDIRVCDGRMFPGGYRLLHTCWAIGDFNNWNRCSEADVPIPFYVNTLEKCKQALSPNNFFRCIIKQLGGMNINIEKNGTFCFEAPDLNAYHDNHTVKYLTMNFSLNKKNTYFNNITNYLNR